MMNVNQFEIELEKMIRRTSPSRVRDAMEYSLMANGKRIRPMILLAVAAGYGVPEEPGLAPAAALEMIHTYSLIHDDLPAMDNDALRRGKPTCHIRFDEATAILAGDGLLTAAFQVLSESSLPSAVKAECALILSRAAGPDGMVLGQCLDIAEQRDLSWEQLKRIHYFKTGCLLSAGFEMGSVLAGVCAEEKNLWRSIGFDIGLAFQIQDDILDVEKTSEELGKTASDARNHKITSVSLLGLEQAREHMNLLYDNSYARIEKIKGFDSDRVLKLLKGVRFRTK